MDSGPKIAIRDAARIGKEVENGMNQRTAGRGRPSGTDGSDFSYRMVVDSRYTKVAKAKSRLAKLIFAQAVTQLLIAVNIFMSLSKKESPDGVSVSSLAIGLVSVLAGELGRKRSRSNFLKFYVFGSSMAILLSVAYLAMTNLSLERSHGSFLVLGRVVNGARYGAKGV